MKLGSHGCLVSFKNTCLIGCAQNPHYTCVITHVNLAVCPGTWLMPGRMIINTESTVGYNNKLKQAIGVNNEVNLGTKKQRLN